MKKAVAFILVAVMTFSMVACAKDKKPEKYCYSCGKAITKTAAFCEHCGAEMNDVAKNDESTPKHIHSYSNYVCSECGAVDNSHAYDYLVEWTKTNGNRHEELYVYVFEENDYASLRMGITYSAADDYLFLWNSDASGDTELYYAIYLNNYFYGLSVGEDEIYGFIPASTYTRDTDLSYVDSACVALEPAEYLSLAESSTSMLLSCFGTFLSRNSLGITLADLGFAVY